MKKVYIVPATTDVILLTEGMLAGSTEQLKINDESATGDQWSNKKDGFAGSAPWTEDKE